MVTAVKSGHRDLLALETKLKPFINYAYFVFLA